MRTAVVNTDSAELTVETSAVVGSIACTVALDLLIAAVAAAFAKLKVVAKIVVLRFVVVDIVMAAAYNTD